MLNKACIFLAVLLINFITALGQSPSHRFFVATANDQLKINSSGLRVNDIASTITIPPAISYPSPQTYGINVPIGQLTPANTGGAVPASVYGQSAVYPVNSSFATLTGVAIDANGNLYVADWSRNAIYLVNPQRQVLLFAGSSNGVSGTNNGQGSAATFYEPDALVMDNAGNIYVSDQGNHLIRKITPGGLVSTLAGSGIAGNADNAIGTSASFNNPRGMTIDAAGNIYVADQGSNAIRKITPAGAVSTVAGSSTAGFTNGNGTAATFNTPTAVGIDNAGNLYVSDSQNAAIRKIAPNGTVTTFATGFTFPRELRVDGTGNIYVVDQTNRNLYRVSPAGVATVVASGYSGPIGLVLDGKGNLYIGDVGYIHKVVISGYAIDKPLPPGLTFDPTTGIITGTPTSLWAATNYTITAYNGGGSSTTVVNIAVAATPKKPSIITLPLQQPGMLDATNNYDPKGTSTNNETPITYTSSNPAVATITANGMVHVIAPGVTTITAYQAGNNNYTDAVPVTQILTVTEYLAVYLPPFAAKTVCSADFSANGVIGDPIIPVAYTSSNPAVATVSAAGLIHIVGTGTTTITLSQNTSQAYYISATPSAQVLTVGMPVTPGISITANYASHCEGDVITFTASTQNQGTSPTYQWQVNNVNTGPNASSFPTNALHNGDKVTCTIINNDSDCLKTFPVASNIIDVTLISPVTPVISIAASTNFVFPGTPITFTATVKDAGDTASYEWYVNGNSAGSNSPTFTSADLVNGDVVKCVIAAANACSTPGESQQLTVTIVSRVEIPNTFTPNSDGVNDTWFITGLANYPDCLVNVYNRYGKLVYRSKGYTNPWNGTVNGSGAPAGTYYYAISLGLQNKVMSGYITVIR